MANAFVRAQSPGPAEGAKAVSYQKPRLVWGNRRQIVAKVFHFDCFRNNMVSCCCCVCCFHAVNLFIFNVLWTFCQVGFGALPEASGRLIADLVVAILTC